MSGFSATLAQIATLLGAPLSDPSAGQTRVRAVATDTRRLPPPPFLFVALSGPNFDGDRFAGEAVRRGATAVVVSDPTCAPPDAPSLVVEDGLRALQTLAEHWRSGFDGLVVAITGSNGKTVVKEMAAAILGQDRRVYRSPGSYNSQVGVALSLLAMPRDAEVALIECGVSRPGEMVPLWRMTRPDHGVLTNIGTAHLAGFGTPERIAEEKLTLFRSLTGTIVCHESARPWARWLPPDGAVVWVGRDPRSDVVVEGADPARSGHRVRLRMGGDSPSSLSFDLASHADHDADNAACAAALADVLGVDSERIRAGLQGYAPAPLRIEVHTSPTDITLINDSYSSDPASVRSALQTLARLSNGRRSVAVLGSMRDLGEASERRHHHVGEQVVELGIDQLVTVGAEARHIARAAMAAGMSSERVISVPDGPACAVVLDRILHPGDAVLVKASRPLQLERTAERLLESISPTRLYVDLGVIAENVRRVRAFIGGDVALFAVVKSFGYGSDAVRVSELLEQQGAAYLMVAYPDEGATLRRRGIQAPILVSSVLPDEADKIVKYRLSAVIYADDLREALAAAARRHGATIPVHVKVDTGMGRFGLLLEQLGDFVRRLQADPAFEVEGLMSHLSVAEEAAQDEYTRGQIARFEEAIRIVRDASVEPRYLHLANSAGLLRFPEAHFNAVRLGLGLYGCLDAAPGPSGSPDLLPAVSLHSRLVGIRDLGEGRSVGYGRTFETRRRTRLGLVALGYNDGLPWALSNRGELWIRQRRVPIVGRVSMDVTTLDLTEVPEAQVGDEVVIFGDGQRGEPTVQEVARTAGTIAYEILCRISPRVRRIVRLAD